MGSNAEQRVTRLENILKDELGTTDLTQYYNRYPVRFLRLTEEVTYDDKGNKLSVAVATWTSPAGVITPTTIRLLINNVKTDLSGNAIEYRIEGHKIGETITVTATAIYTSGNSTSTTATIKLTGDATAPGLPTALTASTGGFRTITLHWTNPADSDLDYIEIWQSSVNDNMETAEAIAQAKGDTFIHSNLGITETHWYWVRAVDLSGNKSNFVGSVSGTTAALVADDIPEAIITESKLAKELSTKIDTTDTLAAVQEDLRKTVKNNGEAVQDALAKVSKLNSQVAGAGIYTDEASGEVKIWGLQKNEERLSEAEIRISAAESSITQRVTVTDMASAIAAAQLDENGQNLFNGLSGRLDTVESTLDGKTDTATTRALNLTVDDNTGRISTAETKIDGINSTINNLATSEEVSDLQTAVTQAQNTIDAASGTITDSISEIDTDRDTNGNSIINTLLNHSEETSANVVASVNAENKLTAHIDEGLSAEAAARLQLRARMEGVEAGVDENASAIVNVDGTVRALYTLRLDANGKVCGFGLSNDGSTSEFTVDVDHFYIYTPDNSGNLVQVFSVSNGQIYVNADLIADGSIVGDKLYAKTKIQLNGGGELLIGQGGLMQIGNGGILLDDEDADNPRILCKDTSVTNGDYIEITSGAVRTFKYLSGSYREIKALTKVVTGTVLNGNTVTLPGYWTSQPYVLVTPAQLKTYVAAFYTVDQTLQMSGANVTYNSSTGVATFKAEAQLVTGASNGTLTVPDQANQTNSNDDAVGTSHTLTTATVTAGFTVSTLTVSASCYGRLGWSHSRENYDRYYEHTVNYTLYLNVDGTDYTMGSGTFTPTQYASSPADHNLTVQLNKSITSIYLKMVFSSSTPTKAWTTGASENTSWIKCNSINYTVNSSTQLATGTVNYIAIAQ